MERLGDFPDVTFDDACLRWLEEKAHKKSLDADKGRIGFWLIHFQGVLLKSISEAKIYAAVSKMTNRKHRDNWESKASSLRKRGDVVEPFVEVPVSISTKAKHLALMKAIMRAAERDWKWIERGPVIKVPQERGKRVRWLEPHEAIRLINECSEPLKSIVVFALATGLRRSNIVDLQWQDVDLQRKVAWIHPEESKSGQAIGVALNDTACRLLRDQVGNHKKWVFVHQKSSTKSDGTKAAEVRKMRVDGNTAWRLALKRAGIDNFRFHDLRHTWASWLVQAGVPLTVLQEMGGWESIEMVQRYAHLAPRHLSAHAKQIDSIFGGHVPNSSQSDNLELLKVV
ncbi:TPA: site-specific integrase [Yersinia enterocolitica]|nr:site-specific integrase [Yersinia enterocolitica]HDL6969676.1 site-specific integrase [Yersinia enterocolitica]HDL6973646.1 site-specific integrase [Yersinia enterocolitica]HDL6986195.1 site-specific integrase [Yersinia enterocolitica]HDL6994724.1 site-specific integrase [Yersinia enterocolitica]